MKEYIVPFTDDADMDKFEMIHGTNGELIRCKDCRNNPKTAVGWIACPMTGSNTRKDDDFCSYGERKEE